MAAEDEPLDLQAVYDDLGGIQEVADELGVPIRRARNWVERRETTGCPEPVKPLKLGPIYSLRAWRSWHRLWRITRGSETWNRGGKPSGDQG